MLSRGFALCASRLVGTLKCTLCRAMNAFALQGHYQRSLCFHLSPEVMPCRRHGKEVTAWHGISRAKGITSSYDMPCCRHGKAKLYFCQKFSHHLWLCLRQCDAQSAKRGHFIAFAEGDAKLCLAVPTAWHGTTFAILW